MRRAAAHALLRHRCSAQPAAAARCLSGAAASAPAVARALADTASDDALTELDLSARGKQPHADLRCINIMCEAPGEACICRLSRVLERPSMQRLHTLRLAGNGLTALPPSVWKLRNLRVLDLRDNRLQSLPADGLAALQLERLELSGNPMHDAGAGRPAS